MQFMGVLLKWVIPIHLSNKAGMNLQGGWLFLQKPMNAAEELWAVNKNMYPHCLREHFLKTREGGVFLFSAVFLCVLHFLYSLYHNNYHSSLQ